MAQLDSQKGKSRIVGESAGAYADDNSDCASMHTAGTHLSAPTTPRQSMLASCLLCADQGTPIHTCKMSAETVRPPAPCRPRARCKPEPRVIARAAAAADQLLCGFSFSVPSEHMALRATVRLLRCSPQVTAARFCVWHTARCAPWRTHRLLRSCPRALGTLEGVVAETLNRPEASGRARTMCCGRGYSTCTGLHSVPRAHASCWRRRRRSALRRLRRMRSAKPRRREFSMLWTPRWLNMRGRWR